MSNADKRLSPAGARFIAGWEGCVLRPYNDSANNATIGIGHLLHLGPVTGRDIASWRGFTQHDAIALLQRDVHQVEEQVRALVHRELEQHEYDATIDITYNCGPGVLESSVGRLINAGELRAAANAMLAWDHAGGHVEPGLRRRREADAHLFLEQAPAYVPSDEARWEREWDQLRGHKGIGAAARRRALRRAMTARRKLIWHLAQHSGWATLNRAQRYRALLNRTEG